MRSLKYECPIRTTSRLMLKAHILIRIICQFGLLNGLEMSRRVIPGVHSVPFRRLFSINVITVSKAGEQDLILVNITLTFFYLINKNTEKRKQHRDTTSSNRADSFLQEPTLFFLSEPEHESHIFYHRLPRAHTAAHPRQTGVHLKWCAVYRLKTSSPFKAPTKKNTCSTVSFLWQKMQVSAACNFLLFRYARIAPCPLKNLHR